MTSAVTKQKKTGHKGHKCVKIFKYLGLGSIEYRTRRRVENIEECARRCLLGTKCDMFTFGPWNQCIYYPHLKLKHLPLYQVGKSSPSS